MKLVRYGEGGRERPGLIDADGRDPRPVGAYARCGRVGARSGCTGQARQGRSRKPAAGRRRDAAHRSLRCRHRQVHLHRPQLLRPCRRDQRHGAARADHLHEGDVGHRRPGRRCPHPARLATRPTGRSSSASSSAARRSTCPRRRRSTTSPATAWCTTFPSARSRPSGRGNGPRARAATRSARSAHGWSPRTRLPIRRTCRCG